MLFQEGWHFLEAIPIVLMSAFSTVLLAAGGQAFDTPVFTLPFHAATWMWLLGSQTFRRLPNSLPFPSLVVPQLNVSGVTPNLNEPEFAFAMLRGVGQVVFLSDKYSGVIILVGLLVVSRVSFAAALVGTLTGTLLGAAVGAAEQTLYPGLWAYNSVGRGSFFNLLLFSFLYHFFFLRRSPF